MPHFVIEFSRSVENRYDVSEIMEVAFDAGVSSSIMKAEDIKVRAIAYDHFRLDGGMTSFFHLGAYLLAGRTPQQKEHFSTLIRSRLADHFPAIESISIDIRDMDPIAYKKRLLTDED